MIESFKKHSMEPNRALKFLENLDTPDQETNTLYLKKDSHPIEFKTIASKMAENFEYNSVQILKNLVNSLIGGGVLFWTETVYVLVVPPFPITEEHRFEYKEMGPLRELLLKDRLVAALLLRLGRYAIGIFHGNQLISSKTDSYLVHSRHRKGGSSQARFARRRIEQSNTFYRRACFVIEEKLAIYENDLEAVFLGGEKTTLEGFRRECRYLSRFNGKIPSRILNSREANQKSLLKLPDLILQSEIYLFNAN